MKKKIQRRKSSKRSRLTKPLWLKANNAMGDLEELANEIEERLNALSPKTTSTDILPLPRKVRRSLSKAIEQIYEGVFSLQSVVSDGEIFLSDSMSEIR